MPQTGATPEPISLSGEWLFQLDPQGTLTVDTLRPDQSIHVPMPWQAAFPELQQYSGYAWYQREFTLSKDFLLADVRLHFGAVDYWCQVFINGVLVGEHEGGYTPFEFGVGSFLHVGQNQVTVRVYDPAQSSMLLDRRPHTEPAANQVPGRPPFDPRDIPHGKQEVYVNAGGIWQDVTLRAVPRTFVDLLHITPDIDKGTATITVRLGGNVEELGNCTLLISVTETRRPLVEQLVSLRSGQEQYVVVLTIADPHLWSLDDPHLYTAHAVLTVEGSPYPATCDTRFGMRQFSTRDGQFLLNAEPIFLLAALDQDFYPDTIYTVPSESFLRDQFHKAKELGFNCLRCHIKVPDPLYLDLADEMGLLVWAEIPSRQEQGVPADIRARVEQTLDAMIRRDFNHPSLVIWTLVNEDWGTSLSLSAQDRAWVSELYDRCKRLDPTRLAVDNSPCGAAWGTNFHVKSDIDDFHVYTAIPDQADTFQSTVELLAMRPLWTYSGYGDSRRRGDEPLVLSEFGNWGLPSLSALRARYDGADPPWLQVDPWGAGWEVEPGSPSGVEGRFQRLGLGRIWNNYEEFARATQMHQYAAMKYEIETIRREPSLAGYVVTELTDIYWESNGLLDFERNPKAYYREFSTLNSPDIIIALPQRYAYRSGEQSNIEVAVSHYSGRASDGALLVWEVPATQLHGTLTLPRMSRGTTRRLGNLRFTAPYTDNVNPLQILFRLCDTQGAELARNTVELTVYSAARRSAALEEPVAVVGKHSHADTNTQPPVTPAATIHGSVAEVYSELLETELPDPIDTAPAGDIKEFATALQRAGYKVAGNQLGDATVAISTAPTAELLRWVRDGGDLLFLCEGASPFFWAQGRGGAYSGNWITGFSWLRPDIHKRLPTQNPLGLPYKEIMPQHVITGLPMDDPALQEDVLAGMVLGWVHHPAAHTVQFQYGRGRVLMTTFRLRSAFGVDPVATAMLHDLIEHLQSDRCRPVLSAQLGEAWS